jgi:hypothetical protein
LSHLWSKLIVKPPLRANTTFSLCLETSSSTIIKSKNLYTDLLNAFENNYVKDLFGGDLLNVFNKTELCVADDDLININITRNFN